MTTTASTDWHVYSLNEISVWGFLLSALAGRQTIVLSVQPVFHRSRPFLQRVADRMIREGRARDITDILPHLRPIREYDHRALLTDYFADLQPWLESYFGFDESAGRAGLYDRAYRHLTFNYVSQRAFVLAALDAVVRKGPEAGVRVHGISADLVHIASTRFGRDFRPFVHVSWFPRRAVNFAIALAILGFAVSWTITRIRFPRDPARQVFFAADFVDDESDALLYDEVVDGGDVLLIARTAAFAEQAHGTPLERYLMCLRTEGHLSPTEAARVCALLFSDIWRLYGLFQSREAAHFSEIVRLPFYRAVWRALFTRYRPRVFWARDSYSVHHLMRQIELHRVGGQSWSVCHSYLTYASVYPEFLYFSFDRYYVLGTGFISSRYRAHWPATMAVVTAGCFRASREHFSARTERKSNDILVLASVSIWQPRFADAVREIAEAFPDRTVRVQVKSNFKPLEARRLYLEHVSAGLDHVEVVEGMPYEYFAISGYCISDPSTAAIEPLAFGLYAFALDLEPDLRSSPLKDLHDVYVTSSEQVIQRIHAIESGKYRYPIEAVSEKIDLSGRVFFDVVRQDLGLAPKEPAVPAWPELRAPVTEAAEGESPAISRAV